ncbi:MAG TPA: oligogalacturonate lyase family protein [Vicinamibacteria bacterium]|nr:oligogalacturonate lyase family protein [Vicinamibacteria bacterium]
MRPSRASIRKAQSPIPTPRRLDTPSRSRLRRRPAANGTALALFVVAAATMHAEEPVAVVSSAANDQLLYFTSTSLLADDDRLVFLSDRSGQPNVFVRDLRTGEDRQLTFNTEGFLKSYVYFDGLPYRGLGRASISVDPRRGLVYFIEGTRLCVVDAATGARRVLAELPSGQMTAFTHVSADGSRLCVPTTDARALDDEKPLKGRPDYDIDARVQAEGLSSYLRVFDTATGREIASERVPKAWITHVQFSPRDSRLILYNHEWPSDCGIRRMWLWNGERHLRLRTEGDGRSRADWTCHEMWERDGSAVIYHGTYDKGSSYVGRVLPDGSGTIEISLPKEWNRYGHFTVGRPGWLVTDGSYVRDGDPRRSGGDWISAVFVDWAARRYDWRPLCRHGSSWTSQDAHPHPVFDHAGGAAYFTSDAGGRRAIYRVTVPDRP